MQMVAMAFSLASSSAVCSRSRRGSVLLWTLWATGTSVGDRINERMGRADRLGGREVLARQMVGDSCTMKLGYGEERERCGGSSTVGGRAGYNVRS